MGVVRIYSRIHCLLGRVPLDSLTLANVADLQLMSNQNQSHADVILVQPNHPISIHLIFWYLKRAYFKRKMIESDIIPRFRGWLAIWFSLKEVFESFLSRTFTDQFSTEVSFKRFNCCNAKYQLFNLNISSNIFILKLNVKIMRLASLWSCVIWNNWLTLLDNGFRKQAALARNATYSPSFLLNRNIELNNRFLDCRAARWTLNQIIKITVMTYKFWVTYES